MPAYVVFTRTKTIDQKELEKYWTGIKATTKGHPIEVLVADEVMFSPSLSVPFDEAATPPELRFAFSQLLQLFQGQISKPEVISELFWASLHGIAELTRTKRFPRSRQKERVRALVERFAFPREETAQVVKAR